MSISILLTYDLENWSPGGWAHYLEGYTIYMSSPEDGAFSPTNGILLADISRGVPIVSLKEKRTVLRGYPYSTCHNDKEWDLYTERFFQLNPGSHKSQRKDQGTSDRSSGLFFFSDYTKNQCRQECMTKGYYLFLVILMTHII